MVHMGCDGGPEPRSHIWHGARDMVASQKVLSK